VQRLTTSQLVTICSRNEKLNLEVQDNVFADFERIEKIVNRIKIQES
jgi:hypothetical protein